MIEVKHLAQYLVNSKRSINGGYCCCCYFIILFPTCTDAVGAHHGQEVVEGGAACSWAGVLGMGIGGGSVLWGKA